MLSNSRNLFAGNVIDKFTLASIYIPTLLIFNFLNSNLFFAALCLMNWYGSQEFFQMRSMILFNNYSGFNTKQKELLRQSNTASIIPRQGNNEWQMYARCFFSSSYLMLGWILWYSGYIHSSYYSLLSYSFLSLTLLGSLYLGTVIKLFNAGELEREEQILVQEEEVEETIISSSTSTMPTSTSSSTRFSVSSSFKREDFLSIGIDFIGFLWLGLSLSLVYNMSTISKSFTTMFLISCWLSEGSSWIAKLFFSDFLGLRGPAISQNNWNVSQTSLESLVLGILAASSFCFFFKPITYIPFGLFGFISDSFYTNIIPYNSALMGGLIALLSFLGTLSLSFMKKSAKVQYSGDMFYDFGGVNDVFKSVCFSAVTMYSLLVATSGM